MTEVIVRIPATSANLGPGFDVLGMALSLHNRVRLAFDEDGEPGEVRVTVEGEGRDSLEGGAENLVYRAAAMLFRRVGAPVPAVALHLLNEIPVSRGLGSSSAAIVGGLVGANTFLGEPLTPAEVLELAVAIEGHPDNVAPALLGGLQICSTTESGLVRLTGEIAPELRFVVCIPEAHVSTEAARSVLPATYSRADAVFNAGRVALLVAGLRSGDAAAIRAGLEDRLHQPYRAPLIPGFGAVLEAARSAGALGACLSGSGSTMLAICSGEGRWVGEAMEAAVRAEGVSAQWLELTPDHAGAVVESV